MKPSMMRLPTSTFSSLTWSCRPRISKTPASVLEDSFMFIEAFHVDDAVDGEPLPIEEDNFVLVACNLLIVQQKHPLHSHGTTSHNTYEGDYRLYA